MSSSPIIGLLILTWGRPKALFYCLENIKKTCFNFSRVRVAIGYEDSDNLLSAAHLGALKEMQYSHNITLYKVESDAMRDSGYLNLAQKFTVLADGEASRTDIMCLWGDRSVFYQNWDVAVDEAHRKFPTKVLTLPEEDTWGFSHILVPSAMQLQLPKGWFFDLIDVFIRAVAEGADALHRVPGPFLIRRMLDQELKFKFGPEEVQLKPGKSDLFACTINYRSHGGKNYDPIIRPHCKSVVKIYKATVRKLRSFQ